MSGSGRLAHRLASAALQRLPASLRGPARRTLELGLPSNVRLARQAVRQGAFQKVGELASLIRLLKAHRLGTVVEIGTMNGGTFWLWCRLAEPDAQLVSVDLPGGAFGGGYDESSIPRLRAHGQAGQRLDFIRRDSHDLATRDELLGLLGGRSVDFLMIDGDHTYEGAKRDFELYAPLVRPGGLIAFHDILPHAEGSACEVNRVWGELRGEYDHFEFLSDEDWGSGQWGGIGVLRWAGARRLASSLSPRRSAR
jgi:predicted O-methyltransferase YrrM